jgi:C-terminal processing protease CtpA/Prc
MNNTNTIRVVNPLRTALTKQCIITQAGAIGVELSSINKILQFSPTSSLKTAGANVGDVIINVGNTDVTGLDNNAVKELIMSSPRPLTLTLKKAQTAGRKRRYRKTRRSRR